MKSRNLGRRRRFGAALFAAITALTASGCLHYQVQIDVAADRSVTVREKIVPESAWRMEAGDTSGATDNVLDQYVKEAIERGGETKRYGRDSATAAFRYPSLEAFVHAWPDSSDNDAFWDRSLLRHKRMDSRDCDELVLFRMSPPDPSKALPNQRYPTLGFTITLPAPAETTNAHSRRGTEYAWRFSERMTRVDSVWVVWPRDGAE